MLTTPTEAEISQLIAAVPASRVGDRDRALLELMLGSGLSTGELARARRDDVRGNSLTVHGSRSHTRTADLTHQAAFHLERYLAGRHDSSPHLFVRHDRARHSRRPSPLTPRSIQRTIEHYRRAAGLRLRVTPASLRRAFVQRVVNHGTSLELVRRLLGHSHPMSTRRLINLIIGTARPATI